MPKPVLLVEDDASIALVITAALEAEGLNTTGDAFAPISVTLMEGGN